MDIFLLVIILMVILTIAGALTVFCQLFGDLFNYSATPLFDKTSRKNEKEIEFILDRLEQRR